MRFKRYFIIIGVLAILIAVFNLTQAADTPTATPKTYKISVGLPGVPGLKTGAEISDPAVYVTGLYNFALAIVGLLALGMIVFGAVEYTISAGNVTGQSEAKDRIAQAIYGLVLLLGAVLILNTINPKIATLTLPTPEKIATEEFLLLKDALERADLAWLASVTVLKEKKDNELRAFDEYKTARITHREVYEQRYDQQGVARFGPTKEALLNVVDKRIQVAIVINERLRAQITERNNYKNWIYAYMESKKEDLEIGDFLNPSLVVLPFPLNMGITAYEVANKIANIFVANWSQDSAMTAVNEQIGNIGPKLSTIAEIREESKKLRTDVEGLTGFDFWYDTAVAHATFVDELIVDRQIIPEQ